MKKLVLALAAVAALGTAPLLATPAAAQVTTTVFTGHSGAQVHVVRHDRRHMHRHRHVTRHHHWRGPRCRTVRERIHRPNGAVVYRTVRRCR
jgi:Ni/Co efflux regulator RcnB